MNDGGIKKLKASDFIGTRVLDSEANEVGKVAELSIILKNCLVENIFISTGSTLNKKYFSIFEEDIAEIGDFVQLNLSKLGVEGKVHLNKIEDFTSKGFSLQKYRWKDCNCSKGMEVGKVADMYIDPKGCLIHNVIVSTGGTFWQKIFNDF